jgi:hypothetical protein
LQPRALLADLERTKPQRIGQRSIEINALSGFARGARVHITEE